jgi:glycosyltransferase involved in cell wall biosynthesis
MPNYANFTGMRNKTIAFFNSTKAWGGGEKWHLEMALQLKERGYNVMVFAQPGSALMERSKQAQLTVVPVRVNNLSFLNPAKFFSFSVLFRKFRPDVLFLNLPSDLKTAGIAAKLAQVPRIVYRRGSAIPVKNTFLNRYLYRRVATDVLANSRATKNTILQNNSRLVEPSKIHVIYNGINLKVWDKRHPEKMAVAKVSPEKMVIGNLGRLVAQKGQEGLLEVANLLKVEHQAPFRMLIGGSGPLEEVLNAKIAAMGLEQDVVLTGAISDNRQFIDSIDVFVLSSHWEGFGYVLAEAMSSRKPAVGFDVSSNPELIQHGVNGFLVPYGDWNAMAEKIVEAYHNRKSLGERGRALVAERFSMEQSVRQVIDAFL